MASFVTFRHKWIRNGVMPASSIGLVLQDFTKERETRIADSEVFDLGSSGSQGAVVDPGGRKK